MTTQTSELARHNHATRAILPPGQCPACDRYHAQAAEPLPEQVPGTHDAQGYLIPDDQLERLERLVGVLSEPLVIYTAELVAEREEARARAAEAEERANRLLRGLQELVAHYPATSWGHAEQAREHAEALLQEMSGQGATMGAPQTPEHGAHPDGKDQDRPAAGPDH